MAQIPGRSGDGKTRRAIVKLLKTEGALDSARLARKLGVTPMAVRQHLYALQHEKMVNAEERPVPLGRPAKFWKLTRDADRLFPEAYAELSVALLDAVGETFGSSGVDRLLQTRLARQKRDYAARIDRGAPLAKKLQQLAKVRTDEGYMAEVHSAGSRAFVFIENHCPICAAATSCQGLCATEIELFQSALGPGVDISRTEHIVNGERRCAYRVSERK
jgi:predicted ArsR family transcriptional regulator